MLKKLILPILCLIGIIGANGQGQGEMPPLTPLEINPKVKCGVLPNGLSYYILHNEQPKQRANFYIAQKVGSTLESQEQLGLAHFLEHMAFNGTSHYPGKTMLDYLQSKGIRFGDDINAYTSFDETVYNINNVPTNDQALMDSVLLVLYDWSGSILLEDAEIEAERGVIQEEWRSRNSAELRMMSTLLPKLYKEYQYQQMPIGKMEVIMNFKPETLKEYYKKWYRPDQQGIIIVGDFDADAMEKKVKELFSTIEMPQNAAKRTYPEVSDNKEPIYAFFSDPELRRAMTTVSFKKDKTPFEYRNTEEIYVYEDMLKIIIDGLMNNRLYERALEPDCAYSGASTYFGDYYISKTKDSFNIVAIAKNNNAAAIEDAMSIVARACQTGFTETELMRVKEEMMANMERMYNERDKTDNDALASELCRLFIDNEPTPGIEKEYEIYQQVLVAYPLEIVNELIKGLLTPDNMVIVTSQPDGSNYEMVTEEMIINTVNKTMNAKYEAYVDEQITEPLIAELPKPGKIQDYIENSGLGVTEYTLSNGIKVIVKSTDYAADEVLMTAYRKGGKQIYEASQAPNVLMISDAYEVSKMGPFNNKMLTRYLTGKNVSLALDVNAYSDRLSGFSTVKDLTTLMELVYTSFTNMSPDQETYDINIQRALPSLKNAENNPQFIFGKVRNNVVYGGDPLMATPTYETIEQANYMESYEMMRKILSNAAEYTFIFTGNVDNATIRPLLEQYIATLPVARKTKPVVATEIAPVKGIVDKVYDQPMQTPATYVYDRYSGNNIEYNAKNQIMVELLGNILDMVYTETLREEEGGTYSPSVFANYNPTLKEWELVYFFITNADQQAKLIKRAQDELDKLFKEGTDMAKFSKVKEAAIKQYEINSKTNNYWNSELTIQYRFPETPIIVGYEDAMRSITLDDFNTFVKNLYDGKNRIELIFQGVEAN